MDFRRCLVVAGWGLALALPALGLPHSKSLAVQASGQEQSLWCWAACAQMIMGFHDHSVTQCQQARERCEPQQCACSECPSGQSNPCTTSPPAVTCNAGGFPHFGCFGFDSKHTDDAPLGWGTIKSEIAAGRPFLVTWRYTDLGDAQADGDDTGHMVAAYGYQTKNGGKYVRYIDPLSQGVCGVGEAKKVTYAGYVSGDTWVHWDDYFGIEPINPKAGCTGKE